MIQHNSQEYKVVIVTPAGREEYLSFFKKFIYRKMDEGLIDGWQLWVNTVKESDIACIDAIGAENPKVKVHRLSTGIVPTYNNCDPFQTYRFFEFTQDDDTIYIRFDDDIVWVEEGAIEKICIARIEHSDAYLIYPNIINSTVCSQWHQDIGAIGFEAGNLLNNAIYPSGNPNQIYLNEFAYTNPDFIELIHTTFRKRYEEGSLNAYYLPNRSLDNFQRFSICSICWWGKDHLQGGTIEESHLAWEEPERLQKPVWFCGDALMVHFSYHTQVDHLRTKPHFLEYYKSITK